MDHEPEHRQCGCSPIAAIVAALVELLQRYPDIKLENGQIIWPDGKVPDAQR